jgi:nucleoside-diphosphate-sugar epimerase
MPNTIIGKGMIAQAFLKSASNNCIFFCSGVSNSKETSRAEFIREIEVFNKTIKNKTIKNKTVIYFSSYIAESSTTPYALHKKNMENIIENTCDKYLIIRLPSVVGLTKNNTLISYFIKMILNNKVIKIEKDARRHLIDVEDVVRITDYLISNNCYNKSISIGSKSSISPLELIRLISNELNINQIKYELCDGGNNQYSNINVMETILPKKDKIMNKSYNEKLIKKYSKDIKSLLLGDQL